MRGPVVALSAAIPALAILMVTLLAPVPAGAGETVNGRWAADPARCWSDGVTPALSPLVVTGYAVRWLGDTCRIGRMYKTGETVHVEARCWGADGERSIPVSLHPARGGRLQVTWNRGELRRCH